MELKFTDDNFDSEVINCDSPVLVDFYAEWCGPCKIMAPVIDEIADEFEGKVKVGKLNVDDAPTTSSRFSVMSIPTLLLFKGGQVTDTIIGAVPKKVITDKINKCTD